MRCRRSRVRPWPRSRVMRLAAVGERRGGHGRGRVEEQGEVGEERGLVLLDDAAGSRRPRRAPGGRRGAGRRARRRSAPARASPPAPAAPGRRVQLRLGLVGGRCRSAPGRGRRPARGRRRSSAWTGQPPAWKRSRPRCALPSIATPWPPRAGGSGAAGGWKWAPSASISRSASQPGEERAGAWTGQACARPANPRGQDGRALPRRPLGDGEQRQLPGEERHHRQRQQRGQRIIDARLAARVGHGGERRQQARRRDGARRARLPGRRRQAYTPSGAPWYGRLASGTDHPTNGALLSTSLLAHKPCKSGRTARNHLNALLYYSAPRRGGRVDDGGALEKR